MGDLPKRWLKWKKRWEWLSHLDSAISWGQRAWPIVRWIKTWIVRPAMLILGAAWAVVAENWKPLAIAGVAIGWFSLEWFANHDKHRIVAELDQGTSLRQVRADGSVDSIVQPPFLEPTKIYTPTVSQPKTPDEIAEKAKRFSDGVKASQRRGKVDAVSRILSRAREFGQLRAVSTMPHSTYHGHYDSIYRWWEESYRQLRLISPSTAALFGDTLVLVPLRHDNVTVGNVDASPLLDLVDSRIEMLEDCLRSWAVESEG